MQGHENIFAVGDCATLADYPQTPKAGVYAVRQGPVLRDNLEALLEGRPRDADALHLLGLVRGEQDRHAEAVTLIERAISQSPAAAPFRHNVAGIYRRLGRLDEARASFREAVRLEPLVLSDERIAELREHADCTALLELYGATGALDAPEDG